MQSECLAGTVSSHALALYFCQSTAGAVNEPRLQVGFNLGSNPLVVGWDDLPQASVDDLVCKYLCPVAPIDFVAIVFLGVMGGSHHDTSGAVEVKH